MTVATNGTVRRLGEQGLQGWRKQVANAAAPAVSRITPLNENDVRALIALAFIVLSASYVGATLARFARELTQ